MGQQNSKDELLYQQVIEGNVDNIKALSTQGAQLEWIDKKGKTPLIVASMDPRLYIVAKTLVELGANLNAYRPGRHAGVPLHHAAKRGLDQTVRLLLSHGANPFTRNDDCQTPLDVARMKGHCNVVRAIEAHVSYFFGDVSEILVVPGILEPFVPQRLSRKRSKKCWAVVVPGGLANPNKPPKLELAIYNSSQDPHPRTIIALWKCHITEPKFHEPDPTLEIVDKSNGTRYKFLSAIEGNRRQLTQLYNACKGLPEESQAAVNALSNNLFIDDTRRVGPTVPPGANSHPSVAVDVTNGWGDDISSNSTQNEHGSTSRPPTSKASVGGWANQPAVEEFNGWGGPRPGIGTHDIDPPPLVNSAPTAPPMPADIIDVGPIQYPVVDLGPVDLGGLPNNENGNGNGGAGDSSCVICWDAAVEGVCIPCGHMAGCMSCLTEIRAKKGDCPVCRANIDQVIRVYSV